MVDHIEIRGGGELQSADAERLASAALVESWLQGYDPKTSRPTMRRKARALARLLFGEDDEDAAPWAKLAVPGGVDAVRRLRASFLEAAQLSDETNGQDGTSRRTVNSLLSALRGLSKAAWQLGAMDVERLERIRAAAKSLPNSARRAGKRIDALDVRQVIRAGNDGTVGGVLDRAALALLTAGMRRTEVVEARWDRLEPVGQGGTALRVIGKGGKERLVHLADPQVQALEAWRSVSGAPQDGPILRPVLKSGKVTDIPADASRGMSPQALRARIERRSLALGLDLGGLHNLRRWTATTAIEAGVALDQVQAQLGHADPRTTTSYLRRDEEATGAAIRSHFPTVFE